jgi:hypothetical protein
MHMFSPPYAITMNWASRRAVLEEVGRFNETLLRSSDVDCSYRLVAAGYRLVYAPAAVIYHRNERTPWGLVHEGYVHAVHAPRVHALHAEFLARLRTERRSNGSRPAPVAAPAGHWSDPLWQSLFNFGKRLGARTPRGARGRDVLIAFLALNGVIVAAWWRWLTPRSAGLTDAERLMCAAVLGFAQIIGVSLVLGWCGVLSPPPLVLLVAAGSVVLLLVPLRSIDVNPPADVAPSPASEPGAHSGRNGDPIARPSA